ncbi:MAG: hypothetical protein KDB14_30435 [Planctomycetales bacterium]|nr:hypothetical protein [Planctomycetales bacterium]
MLRDPRQIAVSVFNRHPREVMARLEGVWELLAGYLEDGVTAFYFHEFTTCPRSLQALVRWTGVDDVEVEASWLELPVNATRTPTITSYRQIPESIRHAIDPPIRRFLADYFPEQTA